jgi:hypothetical protein
MGVTLEELRARATILRDGYHLFDGDLAQMSLNLEEAEWLYTLVRLMRPMAIHEFGTGLGVSTKFLLQGLLDNGFGEMYSVEPDEALHERARKLLMPTGGCCMVISPDEPRVGVAPDLVFIDSGYQTREADITEWLTNGYQGLLCVHDTNRDYEGLRGKPGVYVPGPNGFWLGRAA